MNMECYKLTLTHTLIDERGTHYNLDEPVTAQSYTRWLNTVRRNRHE